MNGLCVPGLPSIMAAAQTEEPSATREMATNSREGGNETKYKKGTSSERR